MLLEVYNSETINPLSSEFVGTQYCHMQSLNNVDYTFST